MKCFLSLYLIAARLYVCTSHQLVHVNCAVLDLRWNSIGLMGGRALLAALDHNKTVTRMQLAGNNIPADVLRSVGKLCLDYCQLSLFRRYLQTVFNVKYGFTV